MNKLKTKQVFRNYRDLCAFMGWRVAKEHKRDKHFRQLDSLCEYHKEGHKIIIDEVFDISKENKDGRGRKNIYKDNIITLLVHFLSQNKCNVFHKEWLLVNLGLMNNKSLSIRDNVDIKKKLPYCADDHIISSKIVQEAITSHYNKISINLETALNGMQEEELITWKKDYNTYTLNIGKKFKPKTLTQEEVIRLQIANRKNILNFTENGMDGKIEKSKCDNKNSQRLDEHYKQDFMKITEILVLNVDVNKEFNLKLFIKDKAYKQCVRLYNNKKLLGCNAIETIAITYKDFNIEDFNLELEYLHK